MRPIKRFTGDVPPLLKKGEFATNGFILCLGTGEGLYKMFQGVLDFEKDQRISGFELKDSKIRIPSGTPFSKLQELFNALPKLAISKGYNETMLVIEFEDGECINDMNKWIQVRDIKYPIILVAEHSNASTNPEKFVSFVLEKSLEFYNCSSVIIRNIHIKSSDSQGGIYVSGNTKLTLNRCTLESTAEVPCLTPTDSNTELYQCHLKMFSNQNSAIARAVIHGGRLTIDNCWSLEGESPRCLTVDSYGHIVTVGQIEDLHLLQDSIPSPWFLSGLEVKSFTILE